MKTEVALKAANEHLQMAISKHDEFILNKDGKFYALIENNLCISANNIYINTVELQFHSEPYTLALGK